MTPPKPADSETVLILTATARDARLTLELLEQAGLRGDVCRNIGALCEAIASGAGAVLMAEEALGAGSIAPLTDVLQRQPPWSDLPFVVATNPTSQAPSAVAALAEVATVTVLDRPVRVRSMVAAVQAALRGRRRQYAVRRAIESRDQFLAMLGHERRNPRAAIRLAGELLGQGGHEAARDRQLAVIGRQTLHLSRLVDDLLDVARVTHGKVLLQRELLDLNDVLRACFESVEEPARQRSLEYRFEAPAEALPVYGDRVRLEQVFGNLLTNAVKYTPAGGRVTLRAAREDHQAVVHVSDDGIGISAEMVEQIFDLFVQADRTLDRASGGMGLGLTLVQSLVRLHGGEVVAKSGGLGHGSCFSVTLRLADERPSVQPASVPGAGAKPSLRVVIVEDNQDIRELQEALLRMEGHWVASAADGPEGVAMITGERPDLALIDLGLPGYDGFEVARRVRETCGTGIRLVAVSGYGRVEDIERSTAAGFDAHLTKPVGLDELRAMLAS